MSFLFCNLTFKKPSLYAGALYSVLFVSCVSQQKDLAPKFSNNKTFLDLQNFYNTTLENEDWVLFSSLQKIFDAFQELSQENYEKTIELSKDVMFTKGLTPEIYKYSFISYSLSKLVQIDNSYKSQNGRSVDFLNYDFIEFQNNECDDLCSSMGWRILVQNLPNIFTQEGLSQFILTKNYLNDYSIHLKKIDINRIVTSTKNNDVNFLPQNNNDIFQDPVANESNENKIEALKLFENGKFYESIEKFMEMRKKTINLDFISMCYYWIGRNYLALNNFNLAKKYLILSGKTNPLNLYDSLSGQLLKTISGRTSTNLKSPFVSSWQEEHEKWMPYPNSIMNFPHANEALNINIEFIKKSIKSSFLLLYLVKKENKITSFEDMQNYFLSLKNKDVIRTKNSLRSFIEFDFLNTNLNWLKVMWLENMQSCCSAPLRGIVSRALVWLSYSKGNFLGASFYVNQVKNQINLSNDENNFLYFVFYPQPFKKEFTNIAQKYSVDRDVLYAIFRQDNLFFTKPSEYQLSECASKIHKLLAENNNNLVHAITSYALSINMNGHYFFEKEKIKDDAFFIETISDKKIQNFVVQVMRNYYNMKWIYSDK